MDDPIPILVGMPVNEKSLHKIGILKYVPSLGAIPVPCDRCAQPAWIGLKQQARKRAQVKIEFICANCLAADLKAAHITDPAEVTVQSCGGKSGTIFMATGAAFLPTPSKEN